MARIVSSNADKIVQIKQFKGLHETRGADTKIGLGEATQCINFRVTRDGNLQRRPGHKVMANLDPTWEEPVKALWSGWVAGKQYMLAACDSKLILCYNGDSNTYPYSTIGSISTSGSVHIFGFDNKAYILDGADYKVWNGTTLSSVDGYIPLIANAISPTGTADAAGTLLEQVNKLTNKRRVWLSPNGSGASFYLPETPQAVDSVKKTSDGSTISGWSLSGKTLTFSSTPASGTNSLEVIYHVSTSYRSQVVAMKYSELYSGASDNRVFLYGDGSNELFYSDIDYDGISRADYFPDMNEVAVGDANTPVTGAIRHFTRLIIFKNNSTWSLSSSTLSLADGSLIPSFYVNPVNRAIGNDAPGQVQLVLNSPRCLFNNELYEWKSSNAYSGNLTSDERQAVRISDRICNTLPTFNFKNAVCYDDNPNQEYYITDYTLGRALVHNYAVNAWYMYTDMWGTCYTSLNGVLYWGNVYGQLESFTEAYLKNDIVCERDVDNNNAIVDVLSSIDAWYETGDMDFGADYARKYTSSVWVSVKPETGSYVETFCVTDRKESAQASEIKIVGKSSDGGFTVTDFASLTFDSGTRPHMIKLKIKAKKYVYYKLVFRSNKLDTTTTVLGVDIRTRQTGYAK